MKFARPILILLLAAFFVIVGWWCGPRAFPLANVEFSLTRSQAEVAMKRTIESLGHPLEGYKSTSSFGEDEDTKHFIELEYGVPRLEQVTKEGLSVWYWTGRWFKPGQHEEFAAWMDIRGDLAGYEETIKEEEELPSLGRDEALALAEGFLVKYAGHHAAAQRKLVSESVEEKPHRKDHTFVWEQEDLRLGDAPYQLHVMVLGNRVGEYGEGLKVPEHWTREYDRKRELNDLCETLAQYGFSILLMGIGIAFIRGIMRHTIRWKDAAPWGWLAIFVGVSLASSVNSISDALFSYETTQAWPAFVTKQILGMIQEAVLMASTFWLLFLITDAIHRERLPGAGSLRHVLGRGALRDREVVRALGVGILAALGGYAYVSAFYVIGAKFGVWAPVEVDYSKVLSGYIPWIEPMKIGLEAAFSEEFLFRVLAILLLWWVLRVRWLAILLAAVVWAFLHSSYAQMPGYIRGVELTVVGVVWGIFFLRYGIVATLTAHYLYNCWLGSMVVIQSASWLDRVGAIAVAIWPVAFYLWARFRGRHLTDRLPEEMSAAPILPAATVADWNFEPIRLSVRQALGLIGMAVVLVILMNILPLAQVHLKTLGVHDLSREQIAERADAVMLEKGIDPAGYRRIVTSSAGRLPSVRYMLEHGSLNNLADFFRAEWPDLTWNVRYFKFLEKEEYTVRMDQHGKLVRWVHHVPREGSGADLDKDAAIALAKQVLSRDYGIDAAKEELITIDPTKQENRRDYYLVFERRDLGWGEATLRTSITLQGDEPVSFSRWVKIPEAWTREHQKWGWRELLSGEFHIWLGLGVLAIAGTFLVFLVRRHVIPWRLSFLLALLPLGISIADTLNNIPYFFSGYETTTPILNYFIYRLGGIIFSLLGKYLGSVLFIAVALGTARWGFGKRVTNLSWWPRDRTERRTFLLQTAVIVAFSLVCFRFDSFAKNFVAGYFLPSWVAKYSSFAINDAWPWVGAMTNALSAGYAGVITTAFGAGLVALVLRRWGKIAWVILFLIPVVQAVGSEGWTEFFYTILTGEMYMALVVLLVVFLWRLNAPAIFLSFSISSLVAWLDWIWTTGGNPYRWEILPLLGLVIFGGLIVVIAHQRTGDLK